MIVDAGSSIGGKVLEANAPRRSAWGDEVTLEEFLSFLGRLWLPALVGGLIALPIGIIIGLLRPKSYVARASFIAEQTKLSSLPTGLGALAAQFGIDMSGDAGRSPQFYRELITTSGLLRSILDSTIAVDREDARTIRELFGGGSDTSRKVTDRVLRKLRRRIGAEADARTSVVSFGVQARTPAIAERIATVMLSSIRHFNITTRQLQAKERRQFLEGRVADSYQSLRNAEVDLRDFYERNRRFQESPSLLFEESRMKRIIALQQELYTTLSKELETSRIQEVNDTPTITVVDPPFASSRPSGPTVLVLAALFVIMGVCVVGMWLLATELRSQRATPRATTEIG